MIAKALTQKDINAVLLKLYRKEKNCELIQGNVFYNLSLIDANYGKLSSALLDRYSQVTKYQNRIAALNALLYNKIYNLYEKAMSDINTYNSDVEAEAYWSNEYNNASANEAAARRNKETAYSNYEDAQRRYNEIEADYNQRIANKQYQIMMQEAEVQRLTTIRDNVQQLREDGEDTAFDLVWLRTVITVTGEPSSTPYTYSRAIDVSQLLRDSGWYYTWLPFAGRYYVTARKSDGVYRWTTDAGGVQIQVAINSTAGWYDTVIKDELRAAQTDLENWLATNADVETAQANLDAAQATLDTYNAELSQLQTDKTNALAAQQTVINNYYNDYTYYKQQEEYYKNNKLIFKMKRDAARTRKEKSYDAAEASSEAYNDAKDEYEGADKDLLPELPEPWGDMHSPDDEEEDPQDGEGGGNQSDD